MTSKKVKWIKEWFWGYDKKAERVGDFADGDWVKYYRSEFGTIETKPYDNYHNEYLVEKDGYEYWFTKLALAKEFLVDGKETYAFKEPITRKGWQIKLHHTRAKV